MNIAIFSDTYVPQVNGVVTVIRNLEQGLKAKGHNVYIFSVEHPDAMPMDNVFRVPSIKFLWEPQHRIGLIPSKRLMDKIKTLNLDVIHTHSEFSIGMFGQNVAKKYKIPLIHTTHTYYEEYVHYIPLLEEFMKYYVKAEMKRFCNRNTAIVAPSKKIKAALERYEVKAPIQVIPNGIDLNKFFNPPVPDLEKAMNDFRLDFGIKPEDKPIIFVGRIAQEKSIDKLMYNFQKIVQQVPEAKLLIVGDGPEKHSMLKLASDLGIDSRVVFTGYLKWPTEIAVAYRVCKLFMSASSSEVHPMTFIEALATGLPVVAYDDPSIVEMVIEGENGFKFKNKDDLWKGAIEILKSEDMQKKFAAKSLETSKDYSSETFVERMEKMYMKYGLKHNEK